MRTDEAALARMQLDRRLAPLREMNLRTPDRGWIKEIRQSLGMSGSQLAARLRVAPSRISRIERDEVTGATTLKTLRQTAAAISCDVVYVVVPFLPLNELLLERAILKGHVLAQTLCGSLRGSGLWDD